MKYDLRFPFRKNDWTEGRLSLLAHAETSDEELAGDYSLLSLGTAYQSVDA